MSVIPNATLAEFHEYLDEDTGRIHVIYFPKHRPCLETEKLSPSIQTSPPPTAPSPPLSSASLMEFSPSPGCQFLRIGLDICWRYGGTGHHRNVCTRPPILFCSRCGQIGVMSRNCPC
ncbi:unnamed protein product [Psylliodes chrysocephalus]|uniref:CCHC-type domain-containing protein n=1 Tax=Psylliodes chrysocephalus TaxID=3402493 RepID=A0A9P0CRL3_9CUCU|nr:unnamed protein product [Psylliodes chrysocephala]